jgi:hypothetical protein
VWCSLASRTADGIAASRNRGWHPFVIPTDASRRWIDVDALDAPVLSDHRADDSDERAPAPDAVAVVPATFNTLNAWANGSANTYPLVKLCAALGARIPTVAVPFAKHDLAGHPAWLASIAVLRYAGVRVLDPKSGAVGYAEPVESGTGEAVTAAFSWAWVLDQLPPTERLPRGAPEAP